MKRWVWVLVLQVLVVGSVLGVSREFVIDDATNQALTDPAAAYAWEDGVFLTVWSERTTSTSGSIVAQRLNEKGELLDEPFMISTGSSGMRTDPAVAYGTYGGHFLVVYVLNDTAIWGCLCSPSGGKNALFRIATGTNISNPVVSFEPGRNVFVVTYADMGEHTAGTVNSEIFVRHVSINGVLVGSPLQVSNTPSGLHSTHPAVASLAGQSLVVWQRGESSGPYDIYSSKIDNPTTAGGQQVIANAYYSYMNPAIAANDRYHEYLILYSVQSNYGDLARIEGAVKRYDSYRYTAQHSVDSTTHNLTHPSVAYDRSRNMYLAAWSAVEPLVSVEKLIQCRWLKQYGGYGIDYPVITIDSYATLFGGTYSPYVATSDDDAALVIYYHYTYQMMPAYSSHHQICGWFDEACIDADIDCDGRVNLIDVRLLSESWLVGD